MINAEIAYRFLTRIAYCVEEGSDLISNWNESVEIERWYRWGRWRCGWLRMHSHKIYASDAQSLTSASLCIAQELKLKMRNGVCAGITKRMSVGDWKIVEVVVCTYPHRIYAYDARTFTRRIAIILFESITNECSRELKIERLVEKLRMDVCACDRMNFMRMMRRCHQEHCNQCLFGLTKVYWLGDWKMLELDSCACNGIDFVQKLRLYH